MKPSDFQKTIQCQFECKLKKVTKGIVRNYQKELKRRKNKEIPFCELPELVIEKLSVLDDYDSDYNITMTLGYYAHGTFQSAKAELERLAC